MDRQNLVLCTRSFKTETEEFKKGMFYRCMILGEDKMSENVQALVYGLVFDIVELTKNFQFAHTIIMDEWEDIGLVKDGKPISKTEFKTFLDYHKFGRGKGSFYCAFVSNNHPKELCYQFNTFYSDTKPQFTQYSYENYLKVINGDMNSFDNQLICRGNSGIPIGHHAEIYWKDK